MSVKRPAGERGRRLPSWLFAALWAAAALAAHLTLDGGRPGDVAPSRALIVVSSSADSGAASLREAIFRAAYQQGRTRILLRTDRVALRSALPPIVNPAGVVIESEHGRTVIDASSVPGAVLDVGAPATRIRGVEVRGAGGQAVLVRAGGLHLADVVLRDSAVGVELADGVSNVVVEDSLFENNDIGLRSHGDVAQIVVQRNRFVSHRTAAIWAVAAGQIRGGTGDGFYVRANRFETNRYGSVLLNVPSFVEANEFRRSREIAIYLAGSLHRVRDNRILESGNGIHAADAFQSSIILNEITGNGGVGIRVIGGAPLVSGNRLYRNAYGILMLFAADEAQSIVENNLIAAHSLDAICVMASSPILRANRAVGNRGAGVRILELDSRPGETRPVLLSNRLEQNGVPVSRETYAAKGGGT